MDLLVKEGIHQIVEQWSGLWETPLSGEWLLSGRWTGRREPEGVLGGGAAGGVGGETASTFGSFSSSS